MVWTVETAEWMDGLRLCQCARAVWSTDTPLLASKTPGNPFEENLQTKTSGQS